MTKKLHSYHPAELVRNVLEGRPSEAQCGKVVNVTRESFTDEVKDLCGECYTMDQQMNLKTTRRTSWVGILEAVTEALIKNLENETHERKSTQVFKYKTCKGEWQQ